MRRTLTLFAALLLAPLAALHAAEPQLKVGDPAPPLRVGRWVTGSPVAKLEPGRVYAVEFWATWCAPCIASMPHLVELQTKHEKAALTVVAVAVKDDDKAVNAFVAKRKETLNHPVATDTPEGKDAGFMAREWLEKAALEGIPQTFIVDRQGRIAWIGHPMRVDGPLVAVLKGTFDPRQQKQTDKAFGDLDMKLGEAIRETRWRDVLAVVDDMNRIDPTSAPLNYSTRVKALIHLGEAQAANRFAREVAPGASEMIAAHIASELLKASDKGSMDYDLVISLTQQALKNGGSRNPMALSALARAYEGQGKVEDAVRVWRQMLALDDPSIDKENLRKRLEKLQTEP